MLKMPSTISISRQSITTDAVMGEVRSSSNLYLNLPASVQEMNPYLVSDYARRGVNCDITVFIYRFNGYANDVGLGDIITDQFGRNYIISMVVDFSGQSPMLQFNCQYKAA